MQTIHRCVVGLDVHKQTVMACVRQRQGSRELESVREFETSTRGLLELGDWLAEQSVTIAAMESTGVYWKPVWNLLEGRLELMLVNAQHIKQVPGRKTDVKDCQWIAQLLQHGLLRASFVPDRPQRELRDLTRQRSQLVAEKVRAANRIQKVLEDANIKLASVATDVLGASGRDMIRGLIEGQQDAATLADLARYRLRQKIPQLREALHGDVTAHHRFMLKMLIDQVEYLEGQIEQFEQRIEQALRPFEREAVGRLDTIPGISRIAAVGIIAEIGAEMSRFPTAGHLASWAGLCPGHHQSAGKRKSGRIRPGNAWLRTLLVQCAWAASRKKTCYFHSQYRRLAARRGRKRAAIAVAHALLEVIYHVLAEKSVYRDLGPDHFERLKPQRLAKHLIKRLEALGYTVTAEQSAA